jgi:HD-GYP domain-containing protein (c-di-GMP phosphodiesterase class II)
MGHISEYTSVAVDLFKEGQVLPVDIFIYLPLNKNIVFFQRQGDQLTAEDVKKIRALPKNTLLVHRKDSKKLLEQISTGIADKISAGGLGSPEVRAGAASLLQSIESSAPAGELSSPESTRQILADVTLMVEDMLSKFDKSLAVNLYEEILERIRNSEEDPITRHSTEVAAIAVLTLLTIGERKSLLPRPPHPDTLANLGVAGLLHDLGLSQCPKAVVDRHLTGEDENLTVSEKLAFMRHLDITNELLARSGAHLSAEVLAAVEFHHENINGSGFRGLAGNEIPLLARILRIADDLVACISHPKRPVGLKDALAILSERDRHMDQPIYDIDIMNELVTLCS